MNIFVDSVLPVFLRTIVLVGVVLCTVRAMGQGPQFSTADPRFGPVNPRLMRVVPQKTVPAPKSPQPDPTLHEPRAEESPTLLTAAEHPWGRFAPETWTCMQTVTWNYQDDHQTVTVRDTKTTLESLDEDGMILKQSTSTNIGGRRIENAPTRHRFDFFQEPVRENTVITDGGAGKLVIKNTNMVIPCKKRIYETTGPTEVQTTVVWYSTQLYPYVFRVENVLSRRPTETEPENRVLRRSTSEVLESSSFNLRWSKLGTYRIRTVKNDGKVTTVVDTSCSRHIPGGLVHETTREFDASGKEIRTVETKLINYFCTPPRVAATEERNAASDEEVTEDPYDYFEEIPRRPRWWRRWYGVPYF